MRGLEFVGNVDVSINGADGQPSRDGSGEIIIKGKLNNGKNFVANGYVSSYEDEQDMPLLKKSYITDYKIGNDSFTIVGDKGKLPIGRYIDAEDLHNLTELINGRSITIDKTEFGPLKFGGKTIKGQQTSSSLEHSADMKAAVAQAAQPATDFKTAFNSVPGKLQNNKIFLG